MSKADDLRCSMRTYMRMLMTRKKLVSIYHEHEEFVYVMPFHHKHTPSRSISFLRPPTQNNRPIYLNTYRFNGVLTLIRHALHTHAVSV